MKQLVKKVVIQSKIWEIRGLVIPMPGHGVRRAAELSRDITNLPLLLLLFVEQSKINDDIG